MPYSAVIFDLDGTLIDSESLWSVATREVLAEMSFDPAHPVLDRLFGVDMATCAGLLGAAFPGLDLADFDARLTARTDQVEGRGIPLKPGARELLDILHARALPRAIATSTRRDRAHHKLHLTGLDRHFATVVTFDCVDRAKPAPDAYLLAAQRLGVDPGACLVFEDSDPGTRAAHAAGMTVVQVPDMVAPGTDLATHIAPSLLEGARMAGLIA
ncbi:HAD family hydrolase [Albidovulum sediminis]|uniref:HAD family phosphatase n=1 Tax=Albidovulum sediminis TaxID=3066345 RepID=A0ABT2NR56_9RHOB|nr:HAD family phosphatase [Defluviimonas sediminis]MCT8331432.1 HAD family phosphatase [Defluviimonas sediminis]